MPAKIFLLAYIITGCWLAVVSIATTNCVDAPAVSFYFLLASICAVGIAMLYLSWHKETRRKGGEIIERDKP
jgi:hypothetical protein